MEDADIIEVHCKTMFDEGYLITGIPMRRRGDFVQIILHEILYYSKNEKNTVMIQKKVLSQKYNMLAQRTKQMSSVPGL